MSSTSKATSAFTSEDKIQILKNNYNQLASLVLRRGQSSLPTAISLGGTGTNLTPNIQKLSVSGDVMLGPLGFGNSPEIVIGTVNSTPNSISIAQSGPNFYPQITVEGPASTGGQLDYIYGAQYAYQLLFMQGTQVGFSFTVTNNGNIVTLTGANMLLNGRDIWVFMWDPFTSTWRQLTAGTSGVSAPGANTALSNLTSPTNINQSLLFALDDSFNIGSLNQSLAIIYTYKLAKNTARYIDLNPSIAGINNVVAASEDWQVTIGTTQQIGLTSSAMSWGTFAQLFLPDPFTIVTGTLHGLIIGSTTSNKIGFFGTTPSQQLIVTGSRSGGSALSSLLAVLAEYGIIVNNTTA